MYVFDKILFVIDTLDEVDIPLQRALNLAQDCGAGVTCLRLAELPRNDAARTEAEALLAREVEDALGRRQRGQVRVDVRVLDGGSVDVIGVALGKNASVIMKPAQRETSAWGRLFGSLDMQLIRAAPLPVWIVKRGDAKRFTRVLAPVDPDEPADAAGRLNERILHYAVELARMEKAELHVVHAWHYPGEQLLMGRALSEQDRVAITAEVEAEAQRRRELLDHLLAPLDLRHLDAHVHLVKGDAPEAIVTLAQEIGIDLIVMGTISRTGLPGLLIGNVAEEVLGALECSVMVVKPEGFVSPVAPPA